MQTREHGSNPRTAPDALAAQHADVVLVGAGLANTLIAWRLKALRPDLKVLLLERGQQIGGNHTWSFHSSDVTAAQLAWLQPLIVTTWAGQHVRFPGHCRQLSTGYNTISSDRLVEVMSRDLSDAIQVGTDVGSVWPDHVTMADHRVFHAPLVIDGRGALTDQPLALGYQKFYGLELEMRRPHGLAHPIIMDATVEQLDGYRFIYSLPLSPTRMLIEDTYYSDTPHIEPQMLVGRIHAYARTQGWDAGATVRAETAVLPITLAGDFAAHWRTMGLSLPRSGLRAWLFHATTGYSLPHAVRLADAVAGHADLTSASVARLIHAMSAQAWESQAMFRLLNRMLFIAATPAERVRVLERFYTLPQPLIERFYGARLTVADKMRILMGRPPVPVGRALQALPPSAGWRAATAEVAKLG
jgi:lycopene beta-cyclase